MAWYDDIPADLGDRVWRPTAGDTQKTIATDISGGMVGALVIAEAAFDLRVEATIAPTGNDLIWPIGIFVDMQAAVSGPSTITLTGTIDTDLSPLHDLEGRGGLALEVKLGGNALTVVNEGTLHGLAGISVLRDAGAEFTLVNAGLIETYYSPLLTLRGKTILHNTATGVIGTFTSHFFPGEVLELWNEGEIQSTLSVAAATLLNTGMMAGVRCIAAPGLSGMTLVNHGTINDWIDGAATVEQITNSGTIDALNLRGGDDVVVNAGTVTKVLLGTGADSYTAEGGGTAGVVRAGKGDDLVQGAAADDFFFGEEGRDTLTVAEGNDSLWGGGEADLLDGGEGDDALRGGESIDRLRGGAGNDRGWGDSGADLVWGEAGRDQLFGGSGADRLYGGEDGDRLFGGDGDDWLEGGGGRDRMTGGAGRDTFVIEVAPGSHDRIEDFDSGVDRLHLTQAMTFIGSAAFDGKHPALRWDADWRELQADTDGNRFADSWCEIRVYSPGFQITSADFV